MTRVTDADAGAGGAPPLKRRKLFGALMQECQDSAPGSRLSDKIRKRLEVLEAAELELVVDQAPEGCTPLFEACKNGSAEVVDYLVSICRADIERKGLYEVLEEGISHHVTPLWCAAVSGRLAVVKVLLRYSADVNAVSDSGSTPVRSACYIVRHGLNTSHFDIVRCLVRAGADVQQPNHFGGTCLINSVQSPELVRFLLESGVDVNAEDVQHKTALHYAVQEHRLESAKMLLERGADPFRKSKYGDDILQTACLKGALMIFNHLLETVEYEPTRIADAFELIGSTFLLDMHDLGSTLFFWRKALEIRHEGRYTRYPKARNDTLHPVLQAREIDSKEELESVSGDVELLKQQALLITERVLGGGHKDTIFRYMYAGAAHADANRYRPCAALWNHALDLKVAKETLLSCDTSFTARAIVQLYVNVMVRDSLDSVSFDDVFLTTRHVNAGMLDAIRLLGVRPVCKAQLDNFDIVLTTWLHLVLALLRAARDDEDMTLVYSLVNPVLEADPRTRHGDGLLHLAASSSSTLKSNSFLDDDALPLFPSEDVAAFFLRCGHDVHARNALGETPLHVASRPENFARPVAEALLQGHAHLDTPDDRGICPLDILQTHGCKLDVMPFVRLKCLAAQTLLRERVGLDGQPLPPNMAQFIDMHRSTYTPCS